MKLLKQGRTGYQFELDQREGELLHGLIGKFPESTDRVAIISRNGTDAKSSERERLLNESLALHRRELKALAVKLARKLKSTDQGWRLSLTAEERERMLQLLNDIRVESWHALGDPEDLDSPRLNSSGAQLQHHQLLHLAGYFEWNLLEAAADANHR